jgi:hypothetical protein
MLTFFDRRPYVLFNQKCDYLAKEMVVEHPDRGEDRIADAKQDKGRTADIADYGESFFSDHYFLPMPLIILVTESPGIVLRGLVYWIFLAPNPIGSWTPATNPPRIIKTIPTIANQEGTSSAQAMMMAKTTNAAPTDTKVLDNLSMIFAFLPGNECGVWSYSAMRARKSLPTPPTSMRYKPPNNR